MKQLSAMSLFPLEAYVVVDPDEIRSHFPEYHLYAQSNPRRAGELTHREAGYVTEIVTAAALRHGYNVLVDGSLRDCEWYREYFAGLRAEYGALRIAILHITAPREAVSTKGVRAPAALLLPSPLPAAAGGPLMASGRSAPPKAGEVRASSAKWAMRATCPT